MAAVARKYMTKMNKMYALTMAGSEYNERILDVGNGRLEIGGIIIGEVKSDDKDDKDCNKCQYTYIDNELFQNEH